MTQIIEAVRSTAPPVFPCHHLVGWLVVCQKTDEPLLAAKVDAGLNAFVGDCGTKKTIATANGISFGVWKPETHLPLTSWSFYQDANVMCFIEGEFYGDYRCYRASSGEDYELARILSTNYTQLKKKALETLNGSFCGFVFDIRAQELVTFIDRFGVRVLYSSYDKDGTIVSSNLASLRTLRSLYLDPVGAFQFLTVGFPIGHRTLLKNVEIQLPCTVNVFSNGSKRSSYYWNPPKRPKRISLKEATKSLVQAVEDCISRICERIPERKIGLGLTGGHDSRLILSALAYKKVDFDVVQWFEGNFNDTVSQQLCSITKAPLHIKTCTSTELNDIKKEMFVYSDGYFLDDWGFMALGKECGERRIDACVLGFSGDLISGSLTIPEPESLGNIAQLAKCALKNQMELLSLNQAQDLLRDSDRDVAEKTNSEWVASFAAEGWRDTWSDVAIWQRLGNRNLKRVRYGMVSALRYSQLIFPYLDNTVLTSYFNLPIELIKYQRAHCYAGFYRFREFGAFQATSFPIPLATEARFPLMLYSLRLLHHAVGRLKTIILPASSGHIPREYVREVCRSPLFDEKHLKKLLSRSRINFNTISKMRTLDRFYKFYATPPA